jgi:DNA-binding XRE family transcriptional regulator
MVSKRRTNEIWPTPRLIRAARGLAGIDQDTLATCAEVSRKTVILIEGDKSDTMDYRRLEKLQKLQAVLENEHEIEFFPESKKIGEGVRMRKRKRKRPAKRDIVT